MSSFAFLITILYFALQITLAASDENDIDDYITAEGKEWYKKYHPYMLLSQSERRELSDEMLLNFRASIQGALFSGVFGNYTVLQREPYKAALYGAADSPNVGISVAITQTDGNYKDTLSSKTDMKGDWKVVLNDARPNGGDYTLAVSCPKCTNPNMIDTIIHVTFGDVYYCAGQSNMELDMHFTFNRNITYDNINMGKYTNIRYKTQNEIDTSTVTYVVPPQMNPQYSWQMVRPEITNISLSYSLDKFSAPCWYFAQSLDDIYELDDITIGLIDTSVGGSMIEQWCQNQTIQLYCKDSNCPDPSCGGLYNGLVATYLNMTVKAYLWYQGENNVYEQPGSWYNNSGYGCMEPFMLRQWRSQWSVVPGTTSSVAPFGLVTLAGGTSEGHGYNMGRFRWTQIGSFDYLPNHELVNTFAAQAYDTGDPFNKECFYLTPPTCQGDVPYSWNKTNFFMGPIHPRPKLIVGQRLAHSGYNILYKNNTDISNSMWIGPTLSGCKLNNISKIITIQFNKTFILPSGNNNGGIQSDGKIHVNPFVAWYNTSINYTNIRDWTALEVEINRVWYFVPTISEGTDGISIIADLSMVNNGSIDVNKIEGVRYAWSDYPCCGNLNRNYYPCPPNSCPIATGIGNNSLPAVPFWAKINMTNGICSCFMPQTCDSMTM